MDELNLTTHRVRSVSLTLEGDLMMLDPLTFSFYYLVYTLKKVPNEREIKLTPCFFSSNLSKRRLDM